MVQFVLHDENVLFLARHLDVKVHCGVPDVCERTKRAVQKYIEEKGIDKEGTWGQARKFRPLPPCFN